MTAHRGGSCGVGVSSVFALPPWHAGLKTTANIRSATRADHARRAHSSGDADPEQGTMCLHRRANHLVIGRDQRRCASLDRLIARINATKQPGLLHQPKALRYARRAARHTQATM